MLVTILWSTASSICYDMLIRAIHIFTCAEQFPDSDLLLIGIMENGPIKLPRPK